MTRYFFDLADGETIVRDDSGDIFLDLSTARERAKALANATAEHVKSSVHPFDPREFHVRTETGKYVAKIAFRYVTA